MEWSRYLEVTEVAQLTQDLASKYGNSGWFRLVPMPETSVGGTYSDALWLGKGNPEDKDVVVIIGGVHALEWGSCEIALNLAIDLLGSVTGQLPLQYGNVTYTAQQVQDLLTAVHVVVFPLVNPDGRHYSKHIDPLWRKNLNPEYAPPGGGRGGVDLNRNYDFLFNYRDAFANGTGVSGSDDKTSAYYCGPSAFSEPETRNVRWLLNAKFARARWLVDLHACAGHRVLYPWGDDKTQIGDASMRFDSAVLFGHRGLPNDGLQEYMPPDDQKAFEGLAKAVIDAIDAVPGIANYEPGPSYELYPTFGTSHDYAYSRRFDQPLTSKTLGFVIEWADDGKQPDWDREMVPTIRDVCAGLIAFCVAAANANA